MIKNDRQLKITEHKLKDLKNGVERLHKKYGSDKKKYTFLSKGYSQHIMQLKEEIAEYKKIKSSPLPKILHAHNAQQISDMIVRLRIARKITQAQLAARIGCKQADIARLEREDYQGYTLNQLKKLAKGLGAEVELNLIPTR